MLRCKHCKGMLYEEEIWFDQNHVKTMQIGCYQCYKKLQIEYKEWVSFKKKLQRSLENAKSKNENSKVKS